MKFNITLIPGDGIGPEIIGAAVKGLSGIERKYGHSFNYTEAEMGGCSIDRHGVPLTDEALSKAKSSDAVLLGAVGGDVGRSGWYSLPPELRPEAALLRIRKELGLFANLRPAVLYEELSGASPLREGIAKKGFDILIVRELTGGLYFGDRYTESTEAGRRAVDTLVYTEAEIRRIAVRAFEAARKRRGLVTSVDKANVLDSSRLWRQVTHEVAKDYPDVRCEDMLVDNCAMQIASNPSSFDVILTENMFGDILSDEAAAVTGSLGMLPSASLGAGNPGLYEPCHGSAPDIAGKDIANPIAAILSAAMMLRYSFGLEEEAKDIERAVETVLKKGYRTRDIMSAGMTETGCIKMGELINECI